jgi:hypothetical protein
MGYRNVFWYRGGIESWQRAQQIASNMQPQGYQSQPSNMAARNPY